MKKVLLSIFAITLSLGVFAQDSSMNHMNNMEHHKMKSHDGIMMKNGKVMVMENGKTSELTQDRTLSNGTVVSSNGTVKMADGTTKTLTNGDYVNMNGTMGNMKWKGKTNSDNTKWKSKGKTNSMNSDSLKQ